MADMFPTIPTGAPPQAGDKIGRVPAFDSETNRFLLLDGALVERTGREAVQQWFDLMLRQRIDRVPIYRMSGETKLGVDRDMLGSRLPSGLITAEIERNVRERDKADMSRAISPLRQADDAVVLDNSCMTVEQQMAWFMTELERINK